MYCTVCTYTVIHCKRVFILNGTTWKSNGYRRVHDNGFIFNTTCCRYSYRRRYDLMNVVGCATFMQPSGSVQLICIFIQICRNMQEKKILSTLRNVDIFNRNYSRVNCRRICICTSHIIRILLCTFLFRALHTVFITTHFYARSLTLLGLCLEKFFVPFIWFLLVKPKYTTRRRTCRTINVSYNPKSRHTNSSCTNKW